LVLSSGFKIHLKKRFFMLYTFLIILHILVCLVLILIVLLQAGKGANMGAAFGGSSQTVFGSSGAGTFLGKLTAAIAIIFMLTSLTLTYTASHRSSSLMDQKKLPVNEQKLPLPSPDAAQLPAIPPAPASK
jgi:preprotein translocase subunit SecG